MSNKTFVAIAGNIGCGKSSLTTLLAQQFGWKPYYEIVETNPYLADFYGDMKRWSYHLQTFFLTKRFKHQQEIMACQESVIQDRTIYEDAEIFAKNLYLRGQMEERDYKSYVEHFHMMMQFLECPTLLVYLRCDLKTVLERIKLRGRDYEKTIPADYLQQLHNRYESWIAGYNVGPKVTVDVSQRDFVNNAKDLNQVASVIRWELERIQNRNQSELPLRSKLGRPTHGHA